MIRAGELDQRVALEIPFATEDALGAQELAWLPEITVSARVIETPGREFLKGDFKAEEKCVFKIRWRDVDSTWRVVWRERVWRIESVTGTRREGATWIHCTAQGEAN